MRSTSASRIAAIEPNSPASARAAVGPTWRIDSPTTTRHSGRCLAACRVSWRRQRRLQQLGLVEVEDVALVDDDPGLEERDRRLGTEPLDVEGATSRDVEDAVP